MDNVSPLGAVTGGVETILLVEDEPVLRELAKCILQDYGYQILEACTSVEAIAVYEQYKGKIDLLFTDLVMPERMSGRELAQHLKERQPNLQILCTSGYSAEAMGLGLEMNEEFHFLQKPYPPQVLLRMVRTILDQKSKPT